MTSEQFLPTKLSKVDSLHITDHEYLTDGDRCYFLGEYTAQKGYSFSPTNDLISNLKKGMDRLGHPEWRYKDWAIWTAARALGQALDYLQPRALKKITFVPMPPSKKKGDPGYDNRLTKILGLVNPTLPLDFRELIDQNTSTQAVHTGGLRLTPEELMDFYTINELLADPEPSIIAIFDDVLTQGAHFRATHGVLSARFPSAEILGIFLTRRVRAAEEDATI